MFSGKNILTASPLGFLCATILIGVPAVPIVIATAFITVAAQWPIANWSLKSVTMPTNIRARATPPRTDRDGWGSAMVPVGGRWTGNPWFPTEYCIWRLSLVFVVPRVMQLAEKSKG